MSSLGTPLYLSQALRELEYRHKQTQYPFSATDLEGSLMEKAGLATAILAKTLISHATLPILVIVGHGNNGGDALVAARHLQAWGYRVTALMPDGADKLPADAQAAHSVWRAAGGKTETAIPAGDWALVLDGLFGIGLRRPIDGAFQALVRRVNAMSATVLAIDIPSGLNSDTGQVLGAAIRANHTITFIAHKPGLYTLDGADYAGQIHLADLGISLAATPASGHLLERKLFIPALPPRLNNSHKGSFGSVAIIGGGIGTIGAALLAARATLLTGAGRVYAALLADEAPGVDWQQPEIMLCSQQKLTELPQLDCVVAGPGMGDSNMALAALEYWLAQDIPLLLDADALVLIARHPHLKTAMQQRSATSVITPHPGEAAKLLACDNASVQQDRIQSALRLAREFRACCVLKGAGSICATPGGSWFINSSGNPALATAGTGDVLAGIIGSLIAQGLTGLSALTLGVYLHGAAADALVAQGIGPVGLTASELVPAVRRLLNQYNAG